MIKYKILVFLFISSLNIDLLHAQTFFEDAKGKTSILLPIGGNVRINTADASLKFAYFYNRSDMDFVFGLEASGKSNNGLAPIISNELLSPEAHINLNIGYKGVFKNDIDSSGYDIISLRYGIGASRYKLLNSDTSFTQQISSRSFNKLNLDISYNYFLNGNMIFGVYAGYDRTNNTSQLPKIKVKESTVTAIDSTGNVTRITENEYTAWEGEFMTVNQFSLYFDYVYIPDILNNRIALSVYYRGGFNKTISQSTGGFGVYFNKKNDTLRAIGGIIFEFDDLFDTNEVGKSLLKGGTISIVIGYHF